LYNPSPAYLRELVDRIGWKQDVCAQRIGVKVRMLRYYLSLADDHIDAPYPVQFALECLAH
jgi:hypothetical protein